MRIHTKLLLNEMNDLLRSSGAKITYHAITEHQSRTHARAYNVRLAGTGGRNNTGLYGAGDYCGATWDEWGAFLGALFALDWDARVGSAKNPTYANGNDFHYQTAWRFARFKGVHVPPDTHPRHRWQRERGGAWCKSCSAEIQT